MRARVPHLLAYISGHGFGHVAQTAPVLNRLRETLPDFRLTVLTAAPASHLRSRITGDFELVPEATDFGMIMASALEVKVDDSFKAYREFHRDWESRVKAETRRIAAMNADFVLSNVAYLPIVSARSAGVPCAVMCSLNWLDILSHYCSAMPGCREILDTMHGAYEAAGAFLRVTPGMPMHNLRNLKPVGPIARLGRNRRPAINALLGLRPDHRLILVTLGGVATRLPVETWPEIPGVHWLGQADWKERRKDTHDLESLGMDFTDLMTSCDALLCKPGYGSFAEAACNGVPVIYVRRGDWPEEPCLVEWLAQHGRCKEVSRRQLESGDLREAIEALLEQPPAIPPRPTGIEQVADYLLRSISIASP